MQPTEQIVFPPFRLDLVNEHLWREDQLIPLRPKAFAVLRFLIEHAGRLLTKEELLKGVWPETRVSEDILKGYIRDLRAVLGDDAQHPRFIETVPRRGHRFLPAVTTQPIQNVQFKIQNFSEPQYSLQSEILHGKPETLLVGRETELTHLHRLFVKALHGERQLVFVTGEPGIGKTTLIEAFLQGIRGQGVRVGFSTSPTPQNSFGTTALLPLPHPQFPSPVLWVGRGQCIEQHGAGEAYLPVLEALGWIGREPGGEQFVALLNQHAPTWLLQMPTLIKTEEIEALQRRVLGTTQDRMLRELVETIDVLTAQHPLVLWLEDLHWADTSTVDWLAAVAQRSTPARLMIIGTYRPSDLTLHNHPLRSVKQELVAKKQCEELWLPFLSKENVTQYLARRYGRHQFPVEFGAAIHQRTDGNPLFVVNMLEYLVAQGMIAEVDGYWQLQTTIDEIGHRVPESLRQLIEKHLERLSQEQQQLLGVASVAGVTFTTPAVAAGVAVSVEQVEEWCDGLVKRGQFLRAREPHVLPDGTRCGSYGFLHALQQTVVYERLLSLRRARLHRRIGESEEQQYGEQVNLIAAELAVHFERGQEYDKAAQYHHRAGLVALRRHANREAIAHFTQGIALLKLLPTTPERLQQELQLQVALIAPIIMMGGYAAPGLEQACARARELCQQGGDPQQLLLILWRLIGFYLTRAELQTARDLGEQLLGLVHRAHVPTLLPAVHLALGQPLFHLGELALARTHLRQSAILYDPRAYDSSAIDSVQDPGVASLCYEAWNLWLLGYAEQALQRTHAAFRLAEELSHPHNLAWALNYTAALHYFRREPQATQEQAEAAIRLATEQGFPFWVALGTALRGWALAMQGQVEDGITQIYQGLATWQAIGAVVGQPGFMAMLAEVQGQAGLAKEGLRTLAEAFALVSKTEDRYCEAELYRLRGQLTLEARGWRLEAGEEESHISKVTTPNTKVADSRSLPSSHAPSHTPRISPEVVEEAEGYFLSAIAIARQQNAKALELRATMSLVRLRQQLASHAPRTTRHARRAHLVDAYRRLTEVYSWFTEGFDTKDLQEAKALLDSIESQKV